MDEADLATLLGPALAEAFAKKGYETLTPVQEAVLEPELASRDLRITSQTGSGKTVAIGLALRDLLAGDTTAGPGGVARPFGLVVAPTRELARQVEEELSWLYAPLGAKVASTTGGADYRTERRALSAGPAVVVGTPGRLVDHLERGGIDPSRVGAVVLDEADRMLDMGFREELLAILAKVPEGRRTHLVSATFPRDVLALANKVQEDPAHVQGTPLGAANADIDHVIHLVDPRERLNAVVNILLSTPEAQTLIFVRTRADVTDFSRDLANTGFRVASLSGEMEQRERNRALAGFKRGDLDALVATDVAARGIDVQDIARVIHFDPPSDPDTYTHRSGRTGRAGKKGTSCLLIPPSGIQKTTSLLKRAGVGYRFEPIPTADAIRAAEDDRALQELTAPDPEGFEGFDERLWSLAKRVMGAADPTRTVARLLQRTRRTGAEPREIKPITPPAPQRPPALRGDRDARGPHAPRAAHAHAAPRAPHAPGVARAPHDSGAPRVEPSGGWVLFRVSWGSEHGADARRLFAMLCRRGQVEGRDIGTIRVARRHSVVEVAASVAESFGRSASAPDPRNPRVHVSPEREAPAAPHRAPHVPHRAPPHAPPDRPSRARVPADRPSRTRVPADRPSRARVPADRPSRTRVPADRPSRAKLPAAPPDRPSRARTPKSEAPPKRRPPFKPFKKR